MAEKSGQNKTHGLKGRKQQKKKERKEKKMNLLIGNLKLEIQSVVHARVVKNSVCTFA